ncbi:MAG TPA: DUF2378 family protein [Gemmatimonadales bacterium]|nr:DUF2378 family protein [Gemmatimonadales bacterium]
MQQIKGAVLKSRLAFAEEHFGRDGVKRMLASLPPDDQRALRLVFTANWYPFELGKRLDDAIVQVLGEGRPDYFERLGEASAQKNLTSLHDGYLTSDPHSFLEKAPAIYRLYYETGHREYTRVGEREGVLTTYDAETFSAPDCMTVVGWYRRALQLCGAQGIQITEEECRANGGKVCRYRIRWS